MFNYFMFFIIISVFPGPAPSLFDCLLLFKICSLIELRSPFRILEKRTSTHERAFVYRKISVSEEGLRLLKVLVSLKDFFSPLNFSFCFFNYSLHFRFDGFSCPKYFLKFSFFSIT